ncbi:hypothetical protein O181_065340 [Austropuccinia psidii MF-1]|uniref:Integrase catalytic domain-containing protein n=1 Tax=Austropuccinia psidii MF-1 TaxID=1389203 RepID=A0A9Q3I402_9BASI|nr:hypothetical protein [Austropuccinia psidii MF-1]
MTAPSQDTYLRIEQERKSSNEYCCQFLKRLLQNIEETCNRCHKENKYTSKRLGNMIKLQEASRPCKVVNMDWVTGLPLGCDRSYNSFIVSFDNFSKALIFLPCHKYDMAMDTALLIWNRVLSWSSIFTKIIADIDPKFTSALWKNLHQLFGTKLSFSTAYHSQTNGLAERII